jgi:hypothetical protein
LAELEIAEAESEVGDSRDVAEAARQYNRDVKEFVGKGQTEAKAQATKVSSRWTRSGNFDESREGRQAV